MFFVMGLWPLSMWGSVQSDSRLFEFTDLWLKTTPKSGKYSFCFVIEFSVCFISPYSIFKMNWSMLFNIYWIYCSQYSCRESWYLIADTVLLLALFRRNLFHTIKPHRTLKKYSLRPYCALSLSLFTVHVTFSFISLSFDIRDRTHLHAMIDHQNNKPNNSNKCTLMMRFVPFSIILIRFDAYWTLLACIMPACFGGHYSFFY